MNAYSPLRPTKSPPILQLMQVAQGRMAADLVVVNASLLNVYTSEIIENASVSISGDRIACVGPPPDGVIGAATRVIDAGGKFLVPGFIDSHTHLAWFLGIDEFLKCAIPSGATTIISELIEVYPVGGIDGVLDFLDSFQHQPIKLFATAPAMVSISSQTRGIREADLRRLLDREDILGLGEAYWQGVLQTPECFVPAFEQTLEKGKVIEGHSAGARGRKLDVYAACGISSCHEPITADEVVERLRLGIYVMAREGGIRKDLKPIANILAKDIDLRRLIIATDGVGPAELMEKGYLHHVVRLAVEYGFDPITAVQMVTLHPAEHFGIDHLVGGIAPGRYADMLILPDLKTFAPQWVISCGNVVARDGHMTVPPRKHAFSWASCHTVHLPKPLLPSDFSVKVPQPAHTSATLRVIAMVTDLVTAEKSVTLPVVGGEITISTDADLLKIAAVDRAHTPGRIFVGFITGFGLKSGALASSAAWDCADIVVVGTDEADMALAVNRIRELQGGVVYTAGGRVLLELALPVFGLLSSASIAHVVEAVRALNQTLNARGVPFTDPLLTLNTLTGAAIPYLRICEQGLVNLKDGNLNSLFVE